MIQSYEPHRLVIQHLTVLESAPTIVNEVEKRLFDAIDKIIEDWVQSKENWEGVFDYFDNETTFKPLSWEKDEKGTYCAYYAFGNEDNEGYSYYLSPLIGIVPVRCGIWFGVETAWVTRLNGKGAKPSAAWKKYLAVQFPQTTLAASGFELQGENLFMPVRIDAQILAESYPDLLDDALAPIIDALKKIEIAHPQIDELIKAAQEYQFG